MKRIKVLLDLPVGKNERKAVLLDRWKKAKQVWFGLFIITQVTIGCLTSIYLIYKAIV